MDIFGPIRVVNLSGMLYVFVLIDDYSRFTWVCFLAHKNYAFKTFQSFAIRV